MKQPGLINRVINYAGLANGMAKEKYTPDGSASLVNNEDGVPASVSFNYISAVGIMLYLSGYTRSDIAFAVISVRYICLLPSISMKRT